MIIIIIGPSGIGKTTIAEEIEKQCRVLHHNMDLETGSSCDAIQKASSYISCYVEDKEWHILDYGAGFQNNDSFYSILEKWKDFIVNINEPNLENIYKNRDPHRNMAEFLETEFAPHRKKLYNLAKYQVERNNCSKKPANEIIGYFKLPKK